MPASPCLPDRAVLARLASITIVIINLVYPSSPRHTGGVVVLYHYANGLARRGHDVTFVHGPAWPHRIDRLDQLDWFAFDPRVRHLILDVIDDDTAPDGDIVMAPGAPRRMGQPVVVVQGHGLLGGDLDREAFRAPAPKVCVARWLVDVGATYGVAPEQLWHIPYGLDHEHFRALTPQAERPVDVALLYNPHPAKGWAPAEEALTRLRQRRADLTVTAFGIRPPTAPLPDWIDYHLAPGRAQLAGLYDRAKVFLQPSWYEGFGFTAVEAMASGSALVTTDNGGSDDYAEHGRTALVVPPGDVTAMTDAMDALLGDPDRRRALADAGVVTARSFEWNRSAAVLESHLEDYLADPHALQTPPGPGDGPPPRPVGPAHGGTRWAEF